MIKKLLQKSENLYDLHSWIDWLTDVLMLLLTIILPITFIFTFPQFIARGSYFLILLDLVLLALVLMRAFIPSTAQYFGNIIWVFILYVLTISFFVILGPNYARSAWMMLCAVIAAVIYGVRGAMFSSILNIIILLALFYLCDTTSAEWSQARSEGLGHWLMFVGNLSVLCLSTSIPIGFLISRFDRSLKEERHSKETLQESEKRYRLIMENTTDVISIIDMNLHFTYVSPAIMRLRGLTVEEGMAESIKHVLTPESLRRGFALFEEEMQQEATGTAESDRSRILEMELYKKDGSTIWTEISFSFLRDKEGKPIEILMVTRDITERKLADRFFKEVITKNPMSIQILDKEGFTLEVNPSFELLFGATPPSDYSIFNDIQLAKQGMGAIFDQLRNGEVIRIPDTYFNVRDSISGLPDVPVWVKTIGFPLNDSNQKPDRFILMHENITARKQAEESLQKSEDNYRMLATYHKQLNDISIELTEASDTEDLFNRIAESLRLLTKAIATTFSAYDQETRTLKVVSLSTDPISGDKVNSIFGPGLFEMLMPVSAGDMEDMLNHNIRRAKDLCELSFGVMPQEISDAIMDAVGCRQIVALAVSYAEELVGTCIAYLSEDQPVVPDEALRTYIYLSAVAIKRKQADEEKRILEERLQQADKMESIGTLAGGIAHDFNNLLMGMQGYASMTLMNLKQNDPNYERLKRIEEQVRSGADLTSQLLGFARGGRYEIKPSNMNEIIEKTSSMFGRTKKEITIHRKPCSDLWSVEVDRGQMEQVFLNLYVNAWQAMPGGGNIYLETKNEYLKGEQTFPYAMKPGKYIEITITDTGTGMDAKTKEKIFEPFFTTKGMGRGTGLGLASVYGIIKGHGGMINVYSEPGHGTTFSIYLPASEKEVKTEEIPTEGIVMGTETILLIDDEQTVMEINKELLETFGYTVYAAGSGQEGLAVYMEKKDYIDLVILDMIMPGISGGVTFDRLREINPDVKVLLSSGYSLTGEAQEIMDRGCNGFLQKPFKPEELSGKVREMFS